MFLLTFLRKISILLLLTGTTLMLLFIILSGTVHHFPFDTFYWVEADVSSITTVNADVARWTFWGLCYGDAGAASSAFVCSGSGADVPMSPVDNWGFSSELPSAFVDNRDAYFYLSRFAFPFIFIGFGFTAMSLILYLTSSIFKSLPSKVTFFVTLALIFTITASALITAVSVMTRNQFRDVSSGKLNASTMGMMWASTACLLIVFFISCCTASYKIYKKEKHQVTEQPESIPLPPSTLPPQHEEFNQQPAQHESSGIRFFKINRQQEKVEDESVV